MLLVIGVIVWCWGLLSRRPMLRRQGKQKGRCCVLFSDLKVFLLRPPAPSASPPAFIPMNELNGDGNATSSATDSNSLANGHYQPVAGEAADTQGSEDWTHSGVDSPRTLDCCSSSEDCSKEKLDERLSLNSCTDSGVRTPLCRICFQGPEQVRSPHAVTLLCEVNVLGLFIEPICPYSILLFDNSTCCN